MIPKRLQAVVDAVKRGPRRNPPVDAGILFQKQLARRGLLHAFTEEEITEAAVKLGVPADEMNGFLESLASWL